MVDPVGGDDGVVGEVVGEWLARVGIGFVERRAGAGDGDADAVAAVEDLAHPADFDIHLVDLPVAEALRSSGLSWRDLVLNKASGRFRR